MSTATRRAEPAVGERASGVTAVADRLAVIGAGRLPWRLWALASVGGALALVAATASVGPHWLAHVGSVAVATGYAGALGSRTGGRPAVFAALAFVCAVTAMLTGQDLLLSGAAVTTAALAAVLGVMLTVPAADFPSAARECVVALTIAVVGALAAVGFEPAIASDRFEYVALALAFVAAILLVHRLGAGLHGLGRRGLVIVAVGAVLLAGTLLYAELLRRYGTTGLVDQLLGIVSWSRETLGAFPRPIAVVLGVPALAYGCHMRARRRQGWWVLAFGVAATAPAATGLANPSVSILEALLSVVLGLVGGLVIGFVMIRLDLALTGNRGRRSRVAEQAAAVRPEPSRFAPLL